MASKALKCPACPTCYDPEAVHRSRIRLWDLPFLLVGLRPWRCLLCYRRFYARKRGPAPIRAGKPAENG